MAFHGTRNISESNTPIQNIHPLDVLLRERRMPILFVGAGISRRYCNLHSWSELLEQIADRIGISKFQLNGKKVKLESEYPGEGNPHLATWLKNEMMDQISAGSLTRDAFPEMSDEEWSLMEISDPFKTLVSWFTKNLIPTEDDDLLIEIESLKKIADKIPAIITTNYDTFLEKEVFNNFSTLVFPDDYYFSDSNGYGEILKIHGTVERPDTIIITHEDYKRFRGDSKVIVSRITSMMCRNPIIFLGYSHSDTDIHDIIYDLTSSLKQTDLDKIRGHLINVEVDKTNSKAIWNPRKETINGKQIEIMDLKVPNLNMLYDYLNRFEPVATPSEIRKYRSMISDIVLSTDPRTRKVTLIDVSGINSSKPGDLAVIFGRSDSINSLMKGLTGYEISDALLDVLENRIGILDSSSASFITWLSNKRVCSADKYVPVFHYFLKFGIDYRTLSRDVVNFVEDMTDRMVTKISKMDSICRNICNSDEIDCFLSLQNKSFHRYEALAYFYMVGVLERDDYHKRLIEMYNNDKSSVSGGYRLSTELRTAITYLDYKIYAEKYDSDNK